ncbi:AsnC family transcriptional regulator [Rhodobacteraceae bacterium 2CG4]|uniref:AsnC family transcriptional regulator n=1 Tax=Halovulum marinum TaxID=2662447 RepID=A0A6L5YX72_9RHOB|nr:AsnC family transcriptional regulator [Halovulum marinum]
MPDATDRRLIAALRRDARLPVSSLAAALGLSRATVKARIDRLVAAGVISRFTVELGTGQEDDRVRAIVLIELEGSLSRAVIRALAALPQLARLHSTNGNWDLVAEMDCADLRDFDAALRRIREVPGVVSSQSCLLLDTVG